VNLETHWSHASESGSWSWNTSANLRWRPSGRMSLRVGPFFNRTENDRQWVGRFSLEEDHYLFGQLDQETFGMTGRFDFTFKPDLTLQVYAQPFVSAGTYGDFKQVQDPRAQDPGNRYAPVYPSRIEDEYRVDMNGEGVEETFGNPDFNVQQFRSTVVLRWEYRPGSLLYLVWSQGRNNTTSDGRLRFQDNFSDLFGTPSENVFMLKMSYWISP